jgi:hypothetical protein
VKVVPSEMEKFHDSLIRIEFEFVGIVVVAGLTVVEEDEEEYFVEACK